MLENYTNHSGGAIGADTAFEQIGRSYGFINHIHYWYLKPNPSSKPEHEITEYQYLEGIKHIKIANKTLKRKNIDKYMHLLSRNWMQVKYSYSVFAIGTLQSNRIVNGGTGYAVEMCISCNKPVFLYEQNIQQWYKYNYFKESFEECENEDVILTKHFAGIGTRQINEAGISAIHTVYQNTLKHLNIPIDIL